MKQGFIATREAKVVSWAEIIRTLPVSPANHLLNMIFQNRLLMQARRKVMEMVKVSFYELEKMRKQLVGLLTVLHQEEDAGLEHTSLRIEINELEQMARAMNKLMQCSRQC